MMWITVIFLVVILFGGFARLLLAFRFRVPPQGTPAPGRFTTRQKMLILGLVNILFGTVGVFCLANRLLSPVEVFIAVLVITSLPQIAIRTGTTTAKS
jgi:hypothetical protein